MKTIKHTASSKTNKRKCVGIYSPSGSYSDNIEKSKLFDKGIYRLKQNGFKTLIAPNASSKWYQASGTIQQRISDLEYLTKHPDVDIILPSIGGHSTVQLLKYFEPGTICNSGKMFFGFSDNSILSTIINDKAGCITYHSACDVTFGFGRFDDTSSSLTELSFLNAVRENKFDLSGTSSWKCSSPGQANGKLLGGNLKGLSFLCGTKWCPDWSGKILFWESADPLHAVIQQLTHLNNAGIFERIAGMIIGKVSNLRDDFYGKNNVIPISHYLNKTLELENKLPIVIDADIGHDVENVTIPVGAHIELTVEPNKISYSLL